MSSRLTPSGIVAILTDFGLMDHYVGVMKGRILAELLGEANPIFIDITHEIPPQDIRKGALKLKFAYPYFPQGTIFLVIVDPGVGTGRKAIVIVTEKYLFVGPDNGVFTFPAKEAQVLEVFEIDSEKVMRPPFSSTFHGRDLFAPAVAQLLRRVPVEIWTKPLSKEALTLLSFPEPKRTSNGYSLSIWDVDRFGNLITNFSKIMAKKHFKVLVNGQEVRRVNTYGEGRDGEILALFSSEGLLEIAIRNSSAADSLKDPQIEIIFE